jgi:predicted ATPase/class 3 adenylate cyclase
MVLSGSDRDGALRGARSSHALHGERRVVTILFCDVTGSTAMAEQLDPEIWAEIMDDAFELFIHPVQRYGGTVARLMGDAVLAFFGAPTSHEDDPQRAILAGLDIIQGISPFRQQIQQELGLDFNVRVGINTGPVVVGEIGTEKIGEYTAMGDAVNLAARMEQSAQPGTLQISGNTYKWVAPLFDCEPLGELELRGKSDPIPAYWVIARKTVPGSTRGVAGLNAPLVGRAQEKERLFKVLTEVRQGRGQIVTLIGDAGLGKSRLIAELCSEWSKLTDATEAEWLECHGVPYDSQRPFGVFRQLLANYLRLAEFSTPEEILPKIKARNMPFTQEQVSAVSQLMFPSRQNTDMTDFEEHKRQLFNQVTEFWQTVSSSGPLVLVFDDLHWADPISIELLNLLLKLSESRAVLILCATRPYRDAPGWKVKWVAESEFPHRYLEIRLAPLSRSDSSLLLDQLLAVTQLPENLRELLMEKIEGNPFFLEELLRMMIETGILVSSPSGSGWRVDQHLTELAIPENLQALLTARIDHLNLETRHTLQIAAVIGRRFSYPVLEAVTGSAAASSVSTSSAAGGPAAAGSNGLEMRIHELERAQLIRETGREPELTYTFWHELLRDAAYESILLRQRRFSHRKIGEYLENCCPDHLDENAHRLARHFEEAGDAPKALKYYLLAGDAAGRLFASQESINYYSRALELAQATAEVEPDTWIHLYTRRGRSLELGSQYAEAIQNYVELEELGRVRDNGSMQLAAIIPQATIFSTLTALHDPLRGVERSLKALALARELNDYRSEARSLWNLMLAINFSGKDNHQALEYGEQALEIARQNELSEERAHILNDISRVYLLLGMVKQSEAAIREAQDLWRQMNNLPMLADNLTTMAEGYYLLGRHAEAIGLAEEGLRISRSIGNLWGQTYSSSTLGMLYLEVGKIGPAIQLLENSIQMAEQARFKAPLFSSRLALAYLFGTLGNPQHANGYIEGLLQLTDETSFLLDYQKIWLAQRYLLNGELDQLSNSIRAIDAVDLNAYQDSSFFLIYDTVFKINIRLQRYTVLLKIAEAGLQAMQAANVRLSLPDFWGCQGFALWKSGHLEESALAFEKALSEAHSQGSRRSLLIVLGYYLEFAQQQGDQVAFTNRLREANDTIQLMSSSLDILPDETREALRADFYASELVQRILELSNRESIL